MWNSLLIHNSRVVSIYVKTFMSFKPKPPLDFNGSFESMWKVRSISLKVCRDPVETTLAYSLSSSSLNVAFGCSLKAIGGLWLFFVQTFLVWSEAAAAYWVLQCIFQQAVIGLCCIRQWVSVILEESPQWPSLVGWWKTCLSHSFRMLSWQKMALSGS